MSLSTNLISGISSGIDWRTMVDQLIEIEHRSVDLVEDQKSEYEEKLEIFQTINSRLLSFKTQAATLASSDAFNVFTSSLTTNSSTYEASDFFGVTTGTTAGPGTHTITMNSSSTVAEARQISSKSFSDYDAALGLSGVFIINGRAVEVESGDDLQNIMNKVNNLNSGSNVSGVTASILTVSPSSYRLILTSDNAGKDAFTIFDASADGTDILSSGLGYTDGSTSVKNLISNGVQSESFSSSTSTVKSMLDMETAQSGTVTIGAAADPNRFTVSIDLSDSLTEIASAINSAAPGGSNVEASVVSTTEDGVTTYRLKIKNSTNFIDANNVLQTLGILVGDQGDVNEVHLSDTANNKVGGGVIDAATTIGQIDTTGVPGNDVASDDTIKITGTDHNGLAVSDTFDPADMTTATVQQLLTQIESAFGLGAGTATIDANGKIQVQDDTTGDSRLSINIIANNEGGGSLNFGTLSASTEGYTMEVKAGQDASIIVDGTSVTSSSNLLDGVIAGVTLNLKTIEQGKTVTITIGRDYNSIKSSIQSLLDTYNDVIISINEQFAYDEESEKAGLLQGDSTLRSVKATLTSIVTNSISGISSTMNALSLIGIHSQIDYTDHSNDGMLAIDNDVFMAAMKNYFNDFKRVFNAEGSTTDGDVEYITHTNDTVAGEYAVNITQVAAQAEETGTIDLGAGIGASNAETITISQGGRVAAVIFDGSDNGSSIDNIVNTLNSELDTEYTQAIMGNVKNTTDAAQTTAVNSNTKWNNVYSDGTLAGIANNDVITFTGHTKSGVAVSGSYTVSVASEDTVQGLLSAIESAFDNKVTAAINSYGYLALTNKSSGSSKLDVTITGPAGKNLNFGEITTSNLVSSERLTTDGTNAILSTTKLDATGINGSSVITNDVFKFSGYTVGGSAVKGSFTVDTADTDYDDVGDLLSAIVSAYNAAGGDVTATVQDGRIIIKDGTANSTLGIKIFEPGGKGVDFGTFSGGVTGRHSLDVSASKDGNDRLVITHDDYGSNANLTISQSRSSSDTNYNQIIYSETANSRESSGGNIYINSSTTWDDIYGAGTIETGDTITISGTDRGNAALNPSGVSLIYTIDVSTDTLDTLLTRIEDVFADANNITPTTVEARIENGKIIVEDQTSGISSISLTLVYNDVGGSGTGTLDLGTIGQSTERDLDLGLVNGVHSGLDVQGTINNESATGSGQILTGDSPESGESTSVEGLAIKYTGTGTGAQGNVSITIGIGELFDRALFDITDLYEGYLAFRMDSTEDNINTMNDRIEDMETRLDYRMELLINRFVAMEMALAKIQNMSNWLTGQVQAANSGWM